MYAKNIALQAARSQAPGMKGAWAHMAYHVATDDAQMYRAREMAQLWDLVAQHLDREVKHKSHGLITRPDIKAVADALVRNKSDIAYKVDHG